MPHVLMVAAHFPPMRGSSGVQRTLKFCKYLSQYGWQATVLTINPSAHKLVGNDQLGEIPEDVSVYRVPGFDAARHFAMFGYYPQFLAWPDRWSSWWPGAVFVGMRLIKKKKIDAIWSTYPIATAHLIGLSLSRFASLPWVADFRDSMTEEGYPKNSFVRRQYKWIERRTIRYSSRAVFTAPGTLKMYENRYPASKASMRLIPNGFDEDDFLRIESNLENVSNVRKQTVLLHTGLLYPEERDPRPFFSAIQKLKKNHEVDHSALRVILRSTGHDDLYRSMLQRLDIEDVVELAPNISYEKALEEMYRVDALLIFQGPSCNHQIPAKLFEYVRVGSPVIVLADPQGDTAVLSKSFGYDLIADIGSCEEIEQVLKRFLTEKDAQSFDRIETATVQKYSRAAQTAELAKMLNECIKQVP